MSIPNLVESQLTNLHRTSERNQVFSKLLPISIGLLAVCIIPYLHIGLFGHLVWPVKPTVDRTSCNCGCFDTVFRGIYENPPSSYKHWYFNSTLNAYKMWCLMMVGVVVAYECSKYIIRCIIRKEVRWRMVLLFISTLFPHYYGWWNYLNYYNEQFYSQWYHQLYFTVSEIISSGFILQLISKRANVETYHILVILSLNLSHIIIGGLDQFIINLLYGQGNRSQVYRDLGLVGPDFLAVLFISWETQILITERKCSLKSLFYKEELLLSFFVTSAIVLVGKSL